jgi:hypothetical protein
LFLSLNVDGRKQLVLVNRLQQLLVFGLALVFGIGERGHVTELAIEFQLRCATFGKLEQFFGGRHIPILTMLLGIVPAWNAIVETPYIAADVMHRNPVDFGGR